MAKQRNKVTILAFDLATATGVAVGDPSGHPDFWTEVIGSAGTTQASRFANCMNLCNRLIKKYQPTHIFVERPYSQDLLIGLRACVYGVAHMRLVKVDEYTPAAIRKSFIGDGKLVRSAAKKAVIEGCHLRGWNVANDNEADACALWDYARAKMKYAVPTPLELRAEREQKISNGSLQ